MASFNPSQWHGHRDLGALAPGYQADVLVLSDLEPFVPELVLKAGRRVEDVPKVPVPDWVSHTVRIGPVAATTSRFRGRATAVRMIGLVPGQIVTESLEEEPLVEEGQGGLRPHPRPRQDRSRRAAPRYRADRARLREGVRARAGAMASTVAHDAHNIVVVGVDDGDMLRAVQRLSETGGGIVVVDRGIVKAEIKLPIAGLLSDAPLGEVIEASHSCLAAAEQLGCKIPSPFQTMAFLALSVIPSLKITDRGLVDVDAFEIVPSRDPEPIRLQRPRRLVTGWSEAGIGFASARLLARLGARIAITSTTGRIEEREGASQRGR